MRTHLLIDQLAELAGQRNRDALDACFLDLFNDLLSPLSVAIFRPHGDETAPVWSRQRRTQSATERAERPGSLEALPLHQDAWTSGEMRQSDGPPALALVPMGSHQETHCLVEITTAAPLSDVQARLACGVQRFYGHLRALLDENERDSLTRLLNRKSFDETFVRMAMHLESSHAPLDMMEGGRRQPALSSRCWLAVVDIDHFKRVNDSFGHLIGDEVLILVAQVMRKTFRGADRLYRFGGEEFVVLLRVESSVDATIIFDRLRANVARHEFPRVGELTVSIGFTEVRPGDTPSAAFERADQAVYHAKSNGRNLVACHESLMASGSVATRTPVSEVEFF